MRSINGASNSWSESKAAYRFFDNPKVTPEKILEAHVTSTQERIKSHRHILLIQDTSFFNFTSHFELEGRGPIGKRNSRGLIAHSVLAVAPIGEGIPLGLVYQKTWARRAFKESAEERRDRLVKIAPQEKESFKWVEALKGSPSSAEKQVFVHVADREADIDLFLAEAELEDASFLVRGNFDRVTEGNKKLSELIEKLPICARVGISIASVSKTKNRKKSAAREAKLDVRFSKVKLTPTKREPIECWVISAKERSGQGFSPIEWTLLTNLPIETKEEAIEKLGWYRMRWHIENFHKVLKSGCGVERCEVETVERMKNFMALMSVVAWRLYWISRVARVEREADAGIYFSTEELTLLQQYGSSRNKGTQKIELMQAMRWLAQMGGFKGRASDGDPGMISIWRGWQVLQSTMHVIARTRKATCG